MTVSPAFRVLTAAYLGLILFESLAPLSGWREPVGPVFLVLFEWRYSRFDLAANIAAYAPFGFLLAMSFFPRLNVAGAILAAALIGTGVSFAVEVAQVYLPGRVSSKVDLAANAAGSALGALAALVASRTTILSDLRDAWFTNGRWGDLGIALVALLIIASAKPATPLLGNLGKDAGTLAIVINTTLNCSALGLYLAVIARSRRQALPLLLTLIAAVMGLKLLAAWVLFRNQASGVNVETIMGVAYGFLLCALLVWRRENVLPYCVAALVFALAFTLWHGFSFPQLRADERRYQEVTRLIAEWWTTFALIHLAMRPRAAAIIGR